MPSKMIYLSDELFLLLKKESNMSGLIQRSLWEYFNSLKEPVKKEERPVIEVMEEAVKIQTKEQANERLRNAILEEIEEQEKADKETMEDIDAVFS